MKNLFILIILTSSFMMLSSCTKEDKQSDIIVVENGIHKYKKIVLIADGNGNTAEVEISSNIREEVDLDVDDLEFVTTTQALSDNNIETQEIERNEKSTKDYSGIALINAIEVHLNDGITGYRITEKEIRNIRLTSESKSRFAEDNSKTHYAYGTLDNVNGARVRMVSEYDSRCEIDIDLDYLRYNSSWWYTDFEDDIIYSPTTYWAFDEHTSLLRYKWRLDMDVDGNWGRCDNDDGRVEYEWFWNKF